MGQFWKEANVHPAWIDPLNDWPVINQQSDALRKALLQEPATACDALAPALYATLDQLRMQRIIKDAGNALRYLEIDPLLAYEKKLGRSGRVAVMVAVAVVVAITSLR